MIKPSKTRHLYASVHRVFFLLSLMKLILAGFLYGRTPLPLECRSMYIANIFCSVFADLYENYGLFERLKKIEEDLPGANVILHKTPSMVRLDFFFFSGS